MTELTPLTIIWAGALVAGLMARATGLTPVVYTEGRKKAASFMVGFGMLGCAALAFVILDIAHVQNSLLSAQAFFTLMLMCFGLNVGVPLTIHWWRPTFDRALAAEAA